MLTVSSSDAELLRDLMQHEQFQSNLDPELRVWLTDQKSRNLFEAARLADQYVPVQKADRPVYKGQESSSKGHVTQPKSFGESAHSNRNQLRLARMLSLTLSRSPQLLQLVPKSIIMIITRQWMYATTVRPLGTSGLTAANCVQSVSTKRLRCS